MRKRLFQYFFRLEYLAASLLVILLVQVMLVVSRNLPEADETSFLNPILDRIDFLNIADVSLDAIFAVRDAEFPHPRIKVVNIGEVAPTPDGKIAALLYRLRDLGAAVIGLDIILDDLHIERFPPERLMEVEELRLALEDVPNVVLVTGIDLETREPTFEIIPPIRAACDHYGFANLVPDSDGVIRRFLPWAEVNGERWLSFPVQVTQLAAPAATRRLLAQPSEPQVIYYSSTFMQIPTVPIDDVLFGSMYDDFFADAIVLVGFVNEGGLFYLGDTHSTPMGKKVGIEGADMAGVLVHANVIDMMLRDRFITPVPAWADWLLAFLLSYVSIAIYRILRTKPPGRFGVAILITTMLFTEAVIVFFLPLIAFFYFDVKISYNLMATAVLLFIPANAFTTWLHFRIRERRMRRMFRNSANPLPAVICAAFRDNEPFIAHTRLLHAAMTLLQFAHAIRRNTAGEAEPLTAADLHPGVEDWVRWIPELHAVLDPGNDAERNIRHFLMFLGGKKEERMRESLIKDLFLSTELQDFNEFVVFDEWELLLPQVIALWRQRLRAYLDVALLEVREDGSSALLRGCDDSDERGQGNNRELPAGLYRMGKSATQTPVPLSPFCVRAECKLHRKAELFVLAGLMRKQRGLPPVPAYLGEGPNCEAALPASIVAQILEIDRTHIERG
ncbi:MAG: CHASE2 domain-containing protein [Bacteroidota bacterium]|nr:CHASE2 domain-containing protein [Bacteroidota bacterium]